jgi:hypothetical protein
MSVLDSQYGGRWWTIRRLLPAARRSLGGGRTYRQPHARCADPARARSCPLSSGGGQSAFGAGETDTLLARRVLRVADGSSLSRPASKGTDWRIHGVYDLGRGGFTHLEITDNHGGEALDRGQSAAGEIRIGDRNYANAQAWQRFLQKRDGQTDFIVRMRWNTVKLLDQAGAPFDLVNWLQTQPGSSETHEITAWARSGKRQTPIEIRLIARRKPQEAIEAEHKRLRQSASRKQTKLDPRSLIAAE